MTKIYTKTGDTGETSLATGDRVSKSSPIIGVVGSLDESNSFIGLAISHLSLETNYNFISECRLLEKIQNNIFVLGSLASGANVYFELEREVTTLEEYIDSYTLLLPELKNFILPGGSLASSYLHVARSCIRKSERQSVRLEANQKNIFLPYLNRLSDLLFVMSRYVNLKLNYSEKIWKISK